MTKEITDKIKALVLIDGSHYWLTGQEAELAKTAIKKGAKYLELGENLIMASSISRIVNGPDYDDHLRRKNGQWKCQYGHWHERGQECGHGELEKYGNQKTKITADNPAT